MEVYLTFPLYMKSEGAEVPAEETHSSLRALGSPFLDSGVKGLETAVLGSS